MTAGSASVGSPVTRPGLVVGTAMVMLFVAKVLGFTVAPDLIAVAIVAELAAANTSAGAPSATCVASDELAAKVTMTRTPGCERSKSAAILVKDSVKDAAASTVTVD